MSTKPSKRLSEWLKTYWPDFFFSVLILAVVSFVAFKNYTPNTFLTGWDNLHPEFNFKLNVQRSLNAAWQEYQGVGLLGGMAHAADLPRQVFLWGLSAVVPISFIRYFWTFLMLFLGPWGVYFLIKDKSRFGGFTASMFYLFNLATVQYFFVPFETFVNFFGFLPWLIYFSNNYLTSGKNLWKYFLVSLLATCAFYVQTLFVVYVIFLVVFSVAAIFKHKLIGLKRSLSLGITTLFVNAFWLLPVLWFSFTSGQIPSNSDINRIATPETVLMNQARNNFLDIANLRGYWFDYYDFQSDLDSNINSPDKNGKFDYLFKDWIGYTDNIWVTRIGVLLFVLSVLGLVISKQIPWLILLGVGYLMLSGFTPPTYILQEAFRNAFTKWSVAFSLGISVGLGYFVSKFRKISFIPTSILVAASIYAVLPVFNGKLISERVRVNIPTEYFESFNWFNTQTNGERVAFFPAFDKWGWNYHSWGHGGSGFIWYGIKNPILDRAFNVWSPYNEGYHDEITKAILDNDQESFKKTLNKYQVKYLYLDDSVVFPWGEKDLLKLQTVKDFANSLGYAKVAEFGFISIYDTSLQTNKFVRSLNIYKVVNTNLVYSLADPVYAKYGDYVQDEKGLGLPFVNFDTRSDVKIKVISDSLQFINIKTGSTATFPIEEKRISETFASDHGYSDANNCDLKKKGKAERTQEVLGRRYKAFDGGVSCDYFVFPDLKYKNAYVLKVKGQNLQGRSLKIYLYNWKSKRVELEELLPLGNFESYFVIYPKTVGDQQITEEEQINKTAISGYTLNIETRSFGKVVSENLIEVIEFIPFDIDLLTNLYIDTDSDNLSTNNLKVLNVNKWGTAFYKVSVSGAGIFQLGQGYEDGWIAFTKTNDGRIKQLEHLKVNSSSNAWKAPDGGDVYVVFWPQMLEYIGFLLMLLTGLYLIVKSKVVH